MQLQLIGCEHSYYTGKVRAYLRWKGLVFQEVRPGIAIWHDPDAVTA